MKTRKVRTPKVSKRDREGAIGRKPGDGGMNLGEEARGSSRSSVNSKRRYLGRCTASPLMCVRKEAGAKGEKREAKDREAGKEGEAAWQRASGACSLLPDDRVHRLLLAAGAPKSRIFGEATRASLLARGDSLFRRKPRRRESEIGKVDRELRLLAGL